MHSPRLLPDIQSPDHYRSLFRDSSNWDSAIQAICQKHQLNPKVSRSTSGSHIIYKAGDLWIKLMAPIYEKEMLFEIEGLKSVQGRLSVATPEIVVVDSIENWPYVILSSVDGEPIKEIWGNLSPDLQMKLIPTIAKVLKELSNCPISSLVQNRFDWNDFITNQYINCEVQQTKKRMPEVWLRSLKPFLQQFSLSEFTTSAPRFLHSDLSSDHFFISNQSDPKVTGIIDLADCQAGHTEYELAAPAVFIFKNHKEHLRQFLGGMGIEFLNHRFSEKLLAWCLLHRYFMLSDYFKPEMDRCFAGDFKELARLVFPL